MLFDSIKDKYFIIAGPCVMENFDLLETVADEIIKIKKKYDIEIIFKASFDKANRTSVNSYRGPGLEKGLTWLNDIKNKYNLHVTTDIHESWQAKQVGEVVDIIQIPAFLCRQTDLVVEAGKTGKIVNVKKAQFLTATDMKYPLEKVQSVGNDKVILTERGNIMGYNNLVVDFRNIPELQKHRVPVVMDCTHAVQKLGLGSVTGGNREYVVSVAFAAKAFGCKGFFFEVHPEPDKGLSDAANMLELNKFDSLVQNLILDSKSIN